MRSACIFIFILISGINAAAQKQIRLTSPNEKITCIIKTGKSGIFYQVMFNNKSVVDYSKLSLQFSGKEFLSDNIVSRPVFKDTVEKYELLAGRSKNVAAHYKEVTVPLSQGGTRIGLVFRAFDDGAAFRYEFVSSDNNSFAITDEHAEFVLKGDPVAKVLQLPSYTSSHEGFYTTGKLSALKEDTLMDMPALFQFAGGPYLAITEAALLDYAGMYLTIKNNVLRSVLSPLRSDTAVKVKARFPHVSPWRVMLISDKPGDFITSNILTTLCPPNKLSDVSFLKPGKTTFPWWNGNVTPDTLNAPGNNFVTQQYYIDFCARNNIGYQSVVEYGLHQWYVDDGVGFQPGPHSDPTTPVPGLDMKEVCDYAHSKGVGVRVWVHWAALYPKLDSAFANFEKWGLSGMMIDFMDRDDQEMVNMQTEMLEKAAKHKLHIQFHGAYKPTGLSRTYPNEFTREGTLNYEVNKWGDGLPPTHDLDIAFIRLIAGSTDYHLGGFRAVPESKYKAQYTRPLMLGTRCHMMAMYIVLENPLEMVCDYPAAYEEQEGFDFVKEVPTTWDESKVPDAKLDEYMIVARRKGNDWYIGGINNNVARQVTIPLDFTGDGNYSAEGYEDSEDAMNDPNKVNHISKQVSSSDKIKLNLAANGGAVIHLKKN